MIGNKVYPRHLFESPPRRSIRDPFFIFPDLLTTNNLKYLDMDRGPAPKGLQNLAQGFNPGNPQNKRFALKGERCAYRMDLAPIAVRKLAMETFYDRTIGPTFAC
jgi:hypothetical protein